MGAIIIGESSAEHEAYFDAKVLEIPWDVLEEALKILTHHISREQRLMLIQQYRKDKVVFADVGHATWGKALKNNLRSAGLVDSMLPDENWDDYYMQLIEIILGVRKIPLPNYSIPPATLKIHVIQEDDTRKDYSWEFGGDIDTGKRDPVFPVLGNTVAVESDGLSYPKESTTFTYEHHDPVYIGKSCYYYAVDSSEKRIIFYRKALSKVNPDAKRPSKASR